MRRPFVNQGEVRQGSRCIAGSVLSCALPLVLHGSENVVCPQLFLAMGLLAGEDPQGGGVSNRLSAGVGIEFPVDVFDVGFDGFWRDEQLVGNFSLVQLLGQQVQDRTLPCGQGLHHRLGTRRGRGVAFEGFWPRPR